MSEMRPRITKGLTAPFHELDEYPFQDLCRDLFATEPGIATCDVYGTRGQSQYGVDLIAQPRETNSIVVGQCKRYRTFPPRHIQKASQEFLRHWEHYWQSRGVRRFVLFVACSLDNRQQQEKIGEQRKRFAGLGIAYEAWSAETIQNKLRPHRSIVEAYCHPSHIWVREICGQVPGADHTPSVSAQDSAVYRLLEVQVGELAGRLLKFIADAFETARAAWNEGKRQQAMAWLRDLRSDSIRWAALPQSLRAPIVKFEAIIELETTGELQRVTELLTEAHALDSDVNLAQVEAMVVCRQSGPEPALAHLEGEQDIDGINLRGALQLDMGDVDEALATLDPAAMLVEPNADTYRLRTLAFLLARALDQAQDEIRKALALAPHWESVRLASAVTDYWSCLSSCVLPNQLVPWPEPVDWAFVKRDDTSLICLRRAANAFHSVAQELPVDSERRKNVEAWYLACLLNDPESQEEGERYCQDLLCADPNNYRAFAWAVARSLRVKLKQSERCMLDLIDRGTATVPHVTSVVAHYLASERAKEAIALLARTQAIFRAVDAISIWTVWYGLALMADGQPEQALRTVDDSDAAQELSYVRAAALQKMAQSEHQIDECIGYMECQYRSTGDARYLLYGCEFMHSRGRWDYVVKHADELMDRLGTEHALRLLLHAARKAQEYQKCLELIDTNRAVFPHQEIPTDIKMLRATCLQSRGRVNDAIQELEALKTDSQSTDHLLPLLNLYITRGDLGKVPIIAQELRQQGTLGPQEGLALAQLVQRSDRDLARTIWRQTKQGPVPDEAVGPLYALGHQLGLEDELRELTLRMADLSSTGKGGIKRASHDELVQIVTQLRKREADLNQSYVEGSIPIHFITEGLRVPLATCYHRALEDNERADNLGSRPALYIRHGDCRAAPGSLESEKVRLCLDVTSVLLAQHLGLLEAVERGFGPVYIPQQLVLALDEIRRGLQHPQPSRLATGRRLTELVEGHKLTVLRTKLPCSGDIALADPGREADGDVLVASTIPEQAYVVVFGASGQHGGSPTGDRSVVNCRAVLESLRVRGPLSERDLSQAFQRLGSEGQVAVGPMPEQGRALCCDVGVCQFLAQVGILATVCERFRVYVSEQEWQAVQAETREQERKGSIQCWLDSLIAHLGEGVRAERYKHLPVPAPGILSDVSISLEIECLRSLLGLEGPEQYVLWLDDRFLNSHAYGGKAPIVGVSEVLGALLQKDVIKRDEYYSKLLQLRAANARFIPLEQGEIVFYLHQARIEAGQVLETRDLGVLRQYVAACLQQPHILQQPPISREGVHPHGELPYLVGLSHAINRALSDLWATETDPDVCSARAEWIMSNLYLDLIAMFRVANLPTSLQVKEGTALGLAGLIVNAIYLESGSHDGKGSARQRYMEWLNQRVLQPRFRADPELVQTVGNSLSDLYQSLLRGEHIGEDRKRATRAYLRLLLSDLPDPLRKRLADDAVLARELGVQTVITVGDLAFAPNEFWRAASAAVDGGEDRIGVLGKDTAVVFRPLEDDPTGIGFAFGHPKEPKTVLVRSDDLALLSSSRGLREKALRRNRHWFDCHDDAFERAIAEIIDEPASEERMRKLDSWRDANMALFYANLYTKLSHTKVLEEDGLLPPTMRGLPQYLRLAPDHGGCQTVREATEELTWELTSAGRIEQAFARVAGLPIPLPESLSKAIQNLTTVDRRSLIKRLLRYSSCPLSRVHLVRILLASRGDSPSYVRLARRLIVRLFQEEDDIDAFHAILDWTYKVMSERPEVAGWLPETRLAVTWSHASQLHRLFRALGVPAAWLRDRFSRMSSISLTETFHRDQNFCSDIAHPRFAVPQIILLSSLVYIAGDSTDVLVASLREACLQSFLEKSDRHRVSAFSFRGVAEPKDQMGSFLISDQASALALLEFPDTEAFVPTALRAVLNRVIEGLMQDPTAIGQWTVIAALAADSRIDTDHQERLNVLLMKTDFAALCDQDETLGCQALRTASLRAEFMGQEIRDGLKDHFRAIVGARRIHHQTEQLLDVALNLARVSQQPAKEFADSLACLLDAWPDDMRVRHNVRELVRSLSERLPVEEAQRFWPLLVRLRQE